MPPTCGITRKIMNGNLNMSHKIPAQPVLFWDACTALWRGMTALSPI
jgi:hypothetical protein